METIQDIIDDMLTAFNIPAEPLAPTFEPDGDVHNGRVFFLN